MKAEEQATKFYELKANNYDSVKDLADLFQEYARIHVEKDRESVANQLGFAMTITGRPKDEVDGIKELIINTPINLD